MHGLSKKQQQALLAVLESMGWVFRGPDDRFCEFVKKGSFLSMLEALSAWIVLEPPDILQQIAMMIDSYPDASSFCRALEEAYVRLFISAKEGIAAPLYQSCYEDDNTLLMGKAAHAMQMRFDSKGLSLAEDMHEPPDHLSIELEFFYFLLKNGWTQENNGLLDEAADFAAHTIIPWLRQFHQRLMMSAPGHFYTLVTSLLVCMLKYIASPQKDHFDKRNALRFISIK